MQTNNKTWRKKVVCEQYFALFFVLMISMATFKVMMQLHGNHLNDLADAAFGVISGHPHWIVYQNRLLGPYLVKLISMTGIDRPSSIVIFMLLMIFGQNLLMFELLSRAKVPVGRAISYLVMLSFTFIFLQHFWFYPWDCVDLIIFTLFAWGIYNRRTIAFFLPLFLVAILNRESALFIALYLLIDSFSVTHDVRSLATKKWKIHLTSKTKLVTGTILMITGMAYVKIIRTILFVSSPIAGDDKAHAVLGNHVYFTQNIKDLFFYNLLSLDVTLSAFIIGSTLFMALSVWNCYEEARLKALLMFLALLVNIIIFGFLNESRLYFVLLPFLIFSQVEPDRPDNRL